MDCNGRELFIFIFQLIRWVVQNYSANFPAKNKFTRVDLSISSARNGGGIVLKKSKEGKQNPPQEQVQSNFHNSREQLYCAVLHFFLGLA